MLEEVSAAGHVDVPGGVRWRGDDDRSAAPGHEDVADRVEDCFDSLRG
jgi:hypothetical protein